MVCLNYYYLFNFDYGYFYECVVYMVEYELGYVIGLDYIDEKFVM